MVSMAPYSNPSDVDAEAGQVLVDGPGALAFAMTPEAAEETAQRMIAAASEARQQRQED